VSHAKIDAIILKVIGTLKYEKFDFNCCLFVHIDNYTIIVPTKCTSFY
jgi:hypothetical protein